LEALCNIAAAEILMPMGSIGHLAPADLSIDSLLKLRQQYDVSTEAILIRAVSAARSACEAFCASRIEAAEPEVQYRLDYLIASKSWGITSGRGERLNKPATISQCSAIGYTAKGIEQIGGKDVRVECVGIPAYPGTTFPRVAGVLTPIGEFQSRAPVTFLKGDALEPRGEGPKIIAHIVNDATPMWGGRGFAQAVRRKWPAVQENFAKWVTENESGLSLGSVHLTHVNSELAVASLVSQRGYGASTHARLRYAALESCLVEITRVARKQKASIHMPRIGCGAAGGSWDLVEELIVDTLVASDVPVFVYDLPGVEAPLQSALFLEPR
jgi:O-acetyl-ADP-ribose deacetylase (regulator of RNase III)